MVGGRHGPGDVLLTRGHPALEVADPGRAQRLVDGEPVLHPVAERRADHAGVLGQRVGGVPGRPAAAVLQHLRQVPVVDGDERPDTGLQQRVDQPVVEGQPGRVDRAGAVREHPRPGDGEPVRPDAELAHQRDVLGPAVVVVAGDVAGVAVVDGAGHPAERVPDRRGSPVLGRRALDLVRGGGHAPDEVPAEITQVLHDSPQWTVLLLDGRACRRRARARSRPDPARALAGSGRGRRTPSPARVRAPSGSAAGAHGRVARSRPRPEISVASEPVRSGPAVRAEAQAPAGGAVLQCGRS